MKSTIHFTTLLLAAIFSFALHADPDGLNLEGDLMIHPDQVSSFFALSTDKIKNTANWDWANLNFTVPYKTAWSQVQAKGPFDIQFDTKNIKNQEVNFTMKWASPVISVGQFEIHDVIQRSAGGITATIHLDGMCNNLSMSLPKANWVVSGKMRYDYTAQKFVLSWEDFQFQMSDTVVPVVDMGQCQAAPGLIQRLNETVLSVAGNKAWLGDALRQGVLSWAQEAMDSLQGQLLTERTLEIKDGLMGTWHPKVISHMNNGLIRVAGIFNLTQKGSQFGGGAVVGRDYGDSTLLGVTESGFVFPKKAMQYILDYSYGAGSLQYRLNTNSVPAFSSLMNNRIEELFVWPDLTQFPFHTQFWVDLSAGSAPALGTGRMLTGGGSSYDFAMPMVAHQWAPAGNKYVPYVDFGAPLNGTLSAKIQNGQLSIQLNTKTLDIAPAFRTEFSLFRKVNSWVSKSILSSSIKDFVNKTPFTMAVPSWSWGEGMSLQMSDVQIHEDSFRIPLDFKAIP